MQKNIGKDEEKGKPSYIANVKVKFIAALKNSREISQILTVTV